MCNALLYNGVIFPIQYRGLELTNGLKVLLVSDPTTDKSAAALDVNAGG